SSGPGWGGWPVLVSAMGGLGGGAQHAADLAGGGGRVGDGADSLGPGPVERGMVGGDVVADVGVAAGDVQPFWPAGGDVQGGGELAGVYRGGEGYQGSPAGGQLGGAGLWGGHGGVLSVASRQAAWAGCRCSWWRMRSVSSSGLSACRW